MTLYPPNALKRRLAERKPALGFWLSLNSIAVTEMAAGAGWDWLLLDLEHVLHNDEAVERHLLAAHHGGPAELVVRVPGVEPNLVKRLLDAGVRSFMFPFVQTVDEAKLAVASTRYPPHGVRGFSGGTRATHWGRDADYLKTYADDIFIIAQVESADAVANITAYAAIPGIDAILIGANDLAANMGHLGDTRHPDVLAKFDEAGAAIMKAGKPAGFQFFDLGRSKALFDRGFTLGAIAGDLNTVTRGSDELLAAFR